MVLIKTHNELVRICRQNNGRGKMKVVQKTCEYEKTYLNILKQIVSNPVESPVSENSSLCINKLINIYTDIFFYTWGNVQTVDTFHLFLV